MSTEQNMMELLVQLRALEDDKGNPAISQELAHLIEQGLHHQHLPDTLHPAAAESFQKAFELMGGLPRLALWGDRYPAQFYKLFARMVIPTVAPVLPQPKETQKDEWPEWLTARRLAYQEAGYKVGVDLAKEDPNDADL